VRRDSWDGDAVKGRIFAWAGFDGEDPQPAKARRCFLVYDADEPTLKGSYKLPFADVVDGEPKAVDAGLQAAASRLPGTDIPEDVKERARAVIEHYQERIANSESANSESANSESANSESARMVSEPVAGKLWVGGELLREDQRLELLRRIAAGEVIPSLVFDAEVFLPGDNLNHFYFRDEDLAGFAASFAARPFLRDHDEEHIESRDGTVRRSWLDGGFRQTIELTTARGIKSFAEGQIDRFSIGWFYSGITCSICGKPWISDECSHWWGQEYTDGDGHKQVCGLIFEKPRGKETSAVNVPAVEGTRILAQLSQQKEEVLSMSDKQVVEAVEEVVPVVPVVPVAPVVQAVAKPDEWATFFRDQAMDIALRGSGLPASMQANIRRQLDGEATPARLEAAIQQHKVMLAALQQDTVVTGMGKPLDGGVIISVRAPMEAMANAVDWIFGVPGATLPPPELRRIDRVYHILTGDFDWHGVFRSDQAQLAAADPNTLTGLATNAMNKVIIGLWDGLTRYRWFEPLVTVQPHDGSTHDMQWIQLGGISNLNRVEDGAAYTEKSVADSKESSAFERYGNYVGITLGMIRKSEIAKMQAIPRALTIASVRTRSAAIAGIFTQASGVGPTLNQDSKALFHADHGNLTTDSFSWTAWKAARLECAVQTELGSNKYQGLWPRYCLVPFALYDDALVTFGYGAGPQGKPGTSDYDVNPYAEDRPGDPRPSVVAVPDWTDAYKWAYLADQLLASVIQMSYAQAPGGGVHPQPELFAVTGESSGLMFSNDTMPIKVRDEWAYGVATWRGIGKRNATS
jgi:hypothetical protein